jgi:uncharacterized metal-binding protein
MLQRQSGIFWINFLLYTALNMADTFFTDMSVCSCHTDANYHWHISSDYCGLLTVTDLPMFGEDIDKETSLKGSTRYIWRQLKFLGVPQKCFYVNRHYTPGVSISALNELQYVFSDLFINSHGTHAVAHPVQIINKQSQSFRTQTRNLKIVAMQVRPY